LFRLATIRPAEQWRQLLAAGVFGTLFLFHQILFFAYLCLMDRGFFFPSPALVICLLLALLAAVTGFFRFHFGRLHAYPLAFALILGVTLNSLPRNKVPFPGLIQYYQSLVPLHVDDLPTLSEQLNEPDRRKLFEQAYENLRQRLLARLQAGGDGKP